MGRTYADEIESQEYEQEDEKEEYEQDSEEEHSAEVLGDGFVDIPAIETYSKLKVRTKFPLINVEPVSTE